MHPHLALPWQSYNRTPGSCCPLARLEVSISPCLVALNCWRTTSNLVINLDQRGRATLQMRHSGEIHQRAENKSLKFAVLTANDWFLTVSTLDFKSWYRKKTKLKPNNIAPVDLAVLLIRRRPYKCHSTSKTPTFYLWSVYAWMLFLQVYLCSCLWLKS